MISVVIPIYNGEKYLEQCLDSVVMQQENPLEIILINDGSTDESLRICKEYAQRDLRIRVIDKENTGVSDTRNLGISLAKGDYILFVDADDYLVPDAINKIRNALEKHDFPNMMVYGFSCIGERIAHNDTALLYNHPQDFTSLELLECLLSIDSRQRFRGLVWRCAFKTAMLRANNVMFCTHLKMAEDFNFIADAIFAGNRISVLPEELYVYRVNNDSVTAKYKSNVHGDMVWVNRKLEKKLCGKYPQLQLGLDCCCAETYIVAIQNACLELTPYNLSQRISYAWKIRREFGYTLKLRSACSRWRNLSRRQVVVYIMLRLYMEPLYILLFSAKRGTLLAGTQRK